MLKFSLLRRRWRKVKGKRKKNRKSNQILLSLKMCLTFKKKSNYHQKIGISLTPIKRKERIKASK